MEISPELCVAGRDLTEPRPSPDGGLVAFVARWGAESAVMTVALGAGPVAGGPERILTVGPAPAPGRGFGGGCFDWLPDGSAVVYVARDGDLWLQPLDGRPPRRLTAHGPERSARAPSVSPDGRWVAYVLDEAEVWRCDLDGTADTGAADDADNDLDDDADRSAPRRLDDGGADFCFDPHATATGVRWQAWNVPDMPWDGARVEVVELDRRGEVVARSSRTATGAIQQPTVGPGGEPVEIRDDTGWLNVWVDDRPLVDERLEHAGPSWGMGQRSVAWSPDGTRLAFTRNEAGFGRLCVVDRTTGAVETVGRGVHGQLGWRGDHLVALRSGARTPTQVVAYRHSDEGWGRTVVAVGPPSAWDRVELPEPEVLEVSTPVGDVPVRRYVAPGGNGSGRRTIVWIHGGPTDQWQVTFMPRIALWWSRGWDVVVPDPRGSTGHGRRFQQALNGEWGRADVDDTVAVIGHLQAEGLADPTTTIVMGGSSGGLTALGVLARHRGLAAGGVVLYPVCDLADLAERSHRFEAHSTLRLVGPLEDTERYRDRSPLAAAHLIDVPLLVLHGDADPVVPVEQSRALAERMRAAGRDVELIEFDGEGHGFRDPANRLREFALIGAFLDRLTG